MLTPHQALQQTFGFTEFRPGQLEAVNRALAGQHTLLVMPTGSGKSLAYQLPALLLPGLTLVVSPLIALMKDQVDSLVEMGVPATYINSTLPGEEANRRMRAVREGAVKLLYVAPERLRSRSFTGALARTKISLLAVDEAHCISQWGHDFRPDYLTIGPTWQAMGRPPLLAATATATPTVQQDIVRLLDLDRVQTIVTGFNRPNLTFSVRTTPDARARLQALQELVPRVQGSAIIYTATRRASEEVADFVSAGLGRPAAAYHAGLDGQLRHRIQTDFMAGRRDIIVATSAFGMGVDKADVRAVIHYNMPATVEAYYQEAGRAGRDGLPAECVLFFSPDDLRLQKWLINNDTPNGQELRQIHQLLAGAAREGEVYAMLAELADSSGLHPVKVRVALSELEQAGLLHHLGDEAGYSRWKVLPLSEAALAERTAAVQQRAQARLKLLQHMLEYAQTTACRRQFLLNYFGDSSPASAPRCCDNHAITGIPDLPRAVTPREWLPLVVLETVRSLGERPVGRNRLAQLLGGSQAQAMQQFGYDRHKFYGKLAWLSQRQVLDIIDALLQARYLQLSGGRLPVLALSPAGLEALDARAALPLPLPELSPPGESAAASWQAHSERSDTVQETLALVDQGLTVAQVAARRGLAERTIYDHLARLIADNRLDLHRVVSPEIEAEVLRVVESLGSAARLSPLKAALPQQITFEQIKCVLAAHPELPRRDELSVTEKSVTERIVALGESGKVDGVPELVSFLTHEDGNVRRLAASALGKLADPRAVEPLLQLLQTETKPQVRQYALKALGKIGDDRAASLLKSIAADPDENDYNIKAARLALANLSDTILRSSSGPAAGEPAPPSPAPAADVIIVESVAGLNGALGRTGLAKFLTGSRADWLEAFAGHENYGRLAHLSQRAVLDIIDALISDGRLASTGGFRPKVRLPEPAPVDHSQQSEPKIDLAERTETGHPAASPAQSPAGGSSPSPNVERQRACLTVVADLEGLLTPHGLALLLTAAPGDVAPFSDHDLSGSLHGVLTAQALEEQIEDLIRAGQLVLGRRGRLLLGPGQEPGD